MQASFFHRDATTKPQNEIDQGRVTVVIGAAPVEPAAFVLLRVSRSTDRAVVEGER